MPSGSSKKTNEPQAWANELGADVGEDELRAANRTLEQVIERLER